MLEKTWPVSWGLHHDSRRLRTLTWGSIVRMGVFFDNNDSLAWDLILAHLLSGLRDALNLPTFPIPVGQKQNRTLEWWVLRELYSTQSHGVLGTLSRHQDRGGPVPFMMPGKLVCGGHRRVCHSQQPRLSQRWWEALKTGDGLQTSRRQKRAIERKRQRRRISEVKGDSGTKVHYHAWAEMPWWNILLYKVT